MIPNYLEIEMTKDIDKAKKRLIKKAIKKGMWENFGQKEVGKLSDKYSNHMMTESWNLIVNFDIWCMDFDLGKI